MSDEGQVAWVTQEPRRGFFSWYHDISIGKMKFRNATIIVFDHDGKTQVMEYQVLQAFPTKWVGSELSAAQSNLAVETVEFAHQGLERRK